MGNTDRKKKSKALFKEKKKNHISKHLSDHSPTLFSEKLVKDLGTSL